MATNIFGIMECIKKAERKMGKADLNWKIYIVGHERIYDAQMKGDRKFNNENYCFLNVGMSDRLENADKYRCINQRDLPGFISLGKWWAESEGIYNLWRSGIYKGLQYIGFLHYDIEFRLVCKNRMRESFYLGTDSNITSRINRYIKGKERGHISFQTYSTKADYEQDISADEDHPNELVHGGRNCYEYILEDYNHYFKTSYTLDDIFKQQKINLCSCFLIDVSAFEKMMGFFDWIVQSHKLDIFDTEHRYRLQGGLAERYFGIFMLFEYEEMLDLSLIHLLKK